MPEPIIEQAIAAIAASVAKVTAANGYDTDLQRVLRMNKDPYAESLDRYACVVRDTAHPRNKRFGGPNLTDQEARVQVYCYICLSSEDTDADKHLNRAEADIVKAIRADHVPGESAIFDRIDWVNTIAITQMDEHRPVGGIRLDWDIRFVTNTNDFRVGRS